MKEIWIAVGIAMIGVLLCGVLLSVATFINKVWIFINRPIPMVSADEITIKGTTVIFTGCGIEAKKTLNITK